VSKPLAIGVGLALFAAAVAVAVVLVPEVKPRPSTVIVHPQIDLLALVDPARDAVQGAWTLENGRLVSDAGNASRLEIPYVPPEEYTFTVEFVRRSGNDAVNQIVPREGTVFVWQMGGGDNTVFGISKTTAVRRERCLENGKVYASTVEVRKDRLTIWLNNEKLVDWRQGDRPLAMNDDGRLRQDLLPGLGTRGSVTEFRRITLFEVTGKGRRLRPQGK
jgi:hypothetical protein